MQGIEKHLTRFPIPLHIRAPRTQWDCHSRKSSTATNLDHLQVTHTKGNIFKQKGWDSQTI